MRYNCSDSDEQMENTDQSKRLNLSREKAPEPLILSLCIVQSIFTTQSIVMHSRYAGVFFVSSFVCFGLICNNMITGHEFIYKYSIFVHSNIAKVAHNRPNEMK